MITHVHVLASLSWMLLKLVAEAQSALFSLRCWQMREKKRKEKQRKATVNVEVIWPRMNSVVSFCTAGRCVRSFHVLLINSTCVSLSWSLLENSLVPLFMVVEWLPHKQQDSGPRAETWARLHYTDYPVYLRGSTFSSLLVALLFQSLVMLR